MAPPLFRCRVVEIWPADGAPKTALFSSFPCLRSFVPLRAACCHGRLQPPNTHPVSCSLHHFTSSSTISMANHRHCSVLVVCNSPTNIPSTSWNEAVRCSGDGLVIQRIVWKGHQRSLSSTFNRTIEVLQKDACLSVTPSLLTDSPNVDMSFHCYYHSR